MNHLHNKFSGFFIALLVLPVVTFAQITISPTNLFIEQNSRFGTYLVINNSNEAQEIAVDFHFGYSITDEEGNRRFIQDDSTEAVQYSAADWIRAFPQSFTLEPGSRQVVRLIVNKPNDVEDGTYWARIKTTSSAVSPPLEIQNNSDQVTARVGFQIEQISGLYVKVGEPTTGIEVLEMNYEMNDGRLSIIADLVRSGNSPFLGTIALELIDRNGNVVQDSYSSTTIFLDGIYRQEIDVSNITSGSYTARLTFETSRSDVSDAIIVQAPTVTESIEVNIQ